MAKDMVTAIDLKDVLGRSRVKKLLMVFTLGLQFAGCVHPKVKFHKQRLLDPSMDPAKTGGFYGSYRSDPQQWTEKGSTESGGSLGGSCPTCGG